MESLAEESRIDFESCNLQEEAHFAFSSSNWLHYPSNISEAIFLRYLDYSIRRKNNDLLSHVRKILFCQQNNRSDIIGKSIDDLFAALGDNGSQLKTSLLISSEHLIPKDQYRLLSANINRDNTGAIENPEETKPQENTANTSATQATNSPADIADSFIENGQLNEAMEHLENYLIDNSENQQLAETLASIYITCKEKQRITSFINKLEDKGKPIPSCFNIDTQASIFKELRSSENTERNV